MFLDNKDYKSRGVELPEAGIKITPGAEYLFEDKKGGGIEVKYRIPYSDRIVPSSGFEIRKFTDRYNAVFDYPVSEDHTAKVTFGNSLRVGPTNTLGIHDSSNRSNRQGFLTSIVNQGFEKVESADDATAYSQPEIGLTAIEIDNIKGVYYRPYYGINPYSGFVSAVIPDKSIKDGLNRINGFLAMGSYGFIFQEGVYKRPNILQMNSNFDVSRLDFPVVTAHISPNSDFVLFGSNSQETLQELEFLNGARVADLVNSYRTISRPKGTPPRLGQSDELIDTLLIDNDFVQSNEYTHQMLARPLSVMAELAFSINQPNTRIKYGGYEYKLEVIDKSNPKTQIDNDHYVVFEVTDLYGRTIRATDKMAQDIASIGFYGGLGSATRISPQAIMQSFPI